MVCMYPNNFPQVSASRGSAAQRVDGNLKSASPRFRSRASAVWGATLVAHSLSLCRRGIQDLLKVKNVVNYFFGHEYCIF
jgi:hypothetical protein